MWGQADALIIPDGAMRCEVANGFLLVAARRLSDCWSSIFPKDNCVLNRNVLVLNVNVVISFFQGYIIPTVSLMPSKMWGQLIVFSVYILHLTSAISDHSLSGTEFLFSCHTVTKTEQRDEHTYHCNMIAHTEAEKSIVDIFVPKGFNPNSNPGVRRTRRTLMKRVPLLQEYMKDSRLQVRGIYTAFYLKATSPIQVLLLLDSDPNHWLNGYKLSPQQACFKKYYVSTFNQYPFMAVHTFYETNVETTFSDTLADYEVDCWGDKNFVCKKNTSITVHLKARQVWFFLLEKERVTLHNTLVMTDQPVFVVAGNVFTQHGGTVDSVATTIAPTVTWGKVYIVPYFFAVPRMKNVLILTITAERFPFQFIFDHNGIKNITLYNPRTSEYEYNETNKPAVVSAKKTFGLYALMPLTRYDDTETRAFDLAFIRIIPVEQWKNGFIRVQNAMDRRSGMRYTFFVLSTTKPTNVKHQNVLKYPQWKKLTSEPDNLAYYYNIFEMKGKTSTVYLDGEYGKIILYVRTQPVYFTCTGYAYDYYQTEIYQPTCSESYPVASDGIDNDCDGFIDEELKNDKDDDSDGRVDEDLVESHADGQWSTWIHSCDLKCGSVETKKFIRACDGTLPSRFGKFCDGKNERCGTGGVCPKTCRAGKLTSKCICQPGCSACKNDRAVCGRCAPGYLETYYCLTKCPKGWSGPSCNLLDNSIKAITTTMEQPEESPEEPSDEPLEEPSFSWIWILFTAIFLIGTFGLCFMFLAKKKRETEAVSTVEQRKSHLENEAGNSDDNEEKEQEEVEKEQVEEEQVEEEQSGKMSHGNRSSLLED